MLNEMLKDEELGRILFAEILNQNGCDTGVDTVNMFEEWIKEHPEESLEGEELEQLKQKTIQNRHSNLDEDLVILKDVLDKDDNMEDIPMNIRQLEATKTPKNEPTVRLAEPDYYAGNGLSPLEAFKKGLLSREETIGFIKGNIIKYVTRAGHKHNASEDMVKAIDYCGHLKRLYEHEMQNKPHLEADLAPIDFNDDTAKQAKETVINAFESLDKIQDVRTKP